MKTEHEHDFFFFLHCNEEGWKCGCGLQPGEPPGFAPNLDRDKIGSKVDGILRDMHQAGLVYISNGSHGDHVVAQVIERCRKRETYDQYSIARFILDELQPSHAKYWKKISRGVLKGRDTRARCPCGELSKCSTLKDGENTYRCFKHYGTPTAEIEVPA